MDFPALMLGQVNKGPGYGAVLNMDTKVGDEKENEYDAMLVTEAVRHDADANPAIMSCGQTEIIFLIETLDDVVLKGFGPMPLFRLKTKSETTEVYLNCSSVLGATILKAIERLKSGDLNVGGRIITTQIELKFRAKIAPTRGLVYPDCYPKSKLFVPFNVVIDDHVRGRTSVKIKSHLPMSMGIHRGDKGQHAKPGTGQAPTTVPSTTAPPASSLARMSRASSYLTQLSELEHPLPTTVPSTTAPPASKLKRSSTETIIAPSSIAAASAVKAAARAVRAAARAASAAAEASLRAAEAAEATAEAASEIADTVSVPSKQCI